MKTIIIISIVLLFAFFIGAETKVTLKPFSVRFENLWMGIGWVLFIIGLNVVIMSARYKADKEGFKRGAEAVIEEMQKQQQPTIPISN